MSAFVVELEGEREAVEAWLDDVRGEPGAVLRSVGTVREWPVEGHPSFVRVRAHLVGLDAPLLLGKAAIQDLVASCRRTLRREPMFGSLAVPPPKPFISAVELRDQLLGIAHQDTTSMAARLIDALDTDTGVGDEMARPRTVRQVARLAIRIARDAEEHDRRLGIERRDLADVMWSALADRLERLELEHATSSASRSADADEVGA